MSIVAIKVQPPTPVSGEDATIEVFVANPAELELDVLIWTCVPTGDSSCAEGELGASPAERVVQLRLEGASAAVTVPVPSLELAGVEARTADVLVWTLACVPGRCNILADLAVRPNDPALHTRLDLPLQWDDMPGFDEATLGFRRLEIVASASSSPNRNPRMYTVVHGDRWIAVEGGDPDRGDDMVLRAVVTAGDFELGPGGGWWRGRASGQLFVVASDDRDGVDVDVLTR